MKPLDTEEENIARMLYSNGWNPDDIAQRIQRDRTIGDLDRVSFQVHQFLSVDFNRQMYPVKMYGNLEDLKREKKANEKARLENL